MQTFNNTFGQLVVCIFIDAQHQTGRERFLTMKQKILKVYIGNEVTITIIFWSGIKINMMYPKQR